MVFFYVAQRENHISSYSAVSEPYLVIDVESSSLTNVQILSQFSFSVNEYNADRVSNRNVEKNKFVCFHIFSSV